MSAEGEKVEIPDKDIEKEIVRYLQEHPNAKDTATGIAKWWLTESGRSVQPGQLKEVLEKLVAKQILGKLKISKGEAVFFLDKHQSPKDLMRDV